MKKSWSKETFHWGRWRKILLTMKLTWVIVLLSAFQLSAKVNTQDVRMDLNFEDASLSNVLNEVREVSGYNFVYNSEEIKSKENVSIHVNNASLTEVMDECVKGRDLNYKIVDKTVVLSTASDNKNLGNADQEKTIIKGSVKDKSGVALPGVSVIVKGTTIGVTTDIDGNYSLDVPESGQIIIFSFVGMESQEITLDGKTVVDVVLQDATIGLGEIVAIGYGYQRKEDATGATNRLTQDNMNKGVASDPLAMMQGRVSGVNITNNNGEPGGGVSVRIRGSNSIRSGQTPLYVIDGIPLDNADITPNGGTAAGINQSSNKNPISFLNPNDIESIDILKDASSTAIYGARGANGVVIITTRRGKKGMAKLSYDGYVGVSSIREKLDLLTPSEFRAYKKGDGTSLLDLGASNDWQDQIFRTGITHNHNISYGGGNENTTFRASVGYLDQEGIVKTTGMEKINGKIKVSQNAFDGKLKINGSLIASHVEDFRAPISETGGFEGDLLLTALKLNPTYPIYNPDGSYYQHNKDQRNPLAMLNLVNDITKTDRVLANMSAEYEIIKNLKYKINLGVDQTNAERRVNQDKELSYLVNDGEADINNITATNQLMENYLTYMVDLNEDNHFNFLLGHSYQKFNVSGHNTNVNGFLVDDVKYTNNLQYGNFSAANVDSYAIENELQSFFGRINYNFRDKYLFTFTGRADGSSKFGENKKYGFFPSAAFAWKASDEEFFKNIDALSNLKFRLGWGITGNQEIPNKVSLLAVGTTPSANGYFNGGLSNGITFLRTPNPDIQWETTYQTNFGVDFGFFNNRLSGTIDLYNKKTKDVLLEVPAKAPAAAQTQWQNVPNLEIINKGFELGLNGLIVETKDLSWNLGINFAYVDNNVKNLPVKLIETGNASGQGLSGTRVQIITNNQPIGTFYGLVYQGLDQNGISTYKTDADGNQVKENLGSALPDFTYSFTSGLNYKNFDFSMFWYGSHGNKVYNNTANALFVKGALEKGSNVIKSVSTSSEDPGNSNAYSSRFIEDASFLRLSNVTIGYTFDTKKISWLEKARIYVTGDNLLLFTDYSGYDPEVSSDAGENGVPSLGMDFTSYPKARTFTFGVNLQF